MKHSCISCVLKSLPPHMQDEAAKRAIRKNPSNAAKLAKGVVLPPAEIAILTGKYWGVGGVHLGVTFLDTANTQLKAKILAYANKWSQYGNVKFSESRQGDVRLSTNPGGGYWSYLGTDIHSIDPSSPTMNLDSFSLATPDSEYDRVVCHEFGHTMGCPHEHARQDILTLLDQNKTYIYFWNNYGWSRQEVDDQIFTPLDPSSIWATQPDVTSIMCYQFSGDCTKSGEPIPGGLVIDPLDGSLIAEKYPKSGNGENDGCSDTNAGNTVRATAAQREVIIRASEELHTARSTHRMQGASGSYGKATTPPGRAYDQILTSWHPLMKSMLGADTPPKPPVNPPTPVLPTQLGPFNAPSINFDNGVPVGGWAQLALFQNGSYNFSGHFHVSGAPSYNISFVWGIVSNSGVLYTFAHNGHLAGTFESGSRDSDWNRQEVSGAIAGGWPDLCAGYHWTWNAHVNMDLGAAINSIKQAIEAVQKVVEVITVIIA